jgi:hypothetical protein
MGTSTLDELVDYLENRKLVRVSAIRSVLPLGGIVAKNDRFEVWAFRHRQGHAGNRKYVVSFEAVEVLSRHPRKIREIELPATKRSNLQAICAYLESRT